MKRFLLLLLAAALVSTARADVIITEFLANNSTGLTDEDGTTSDWIEVFNNGTTSVNLAGWRLTDDSGDSTKWIFPAVSLAPNGFLVVFASEKNRTNPATPLHTNFKLSANGGYLALVRQDGSFSTVFNPYPAQYPDKPYGYAQSVSTTTFVGPSAALKYLVPTNDTLGTTWTARTFTDTSWTSGTNGAGFEATVAGWQFKTVFANTGNVSSASIAETVLATPAQQASASSVNHPVINWNNTGSPGHYTTENPPPALNSVADLNFYVVEGTGTITIPTAGIWTFAIGSDDGCTLQIRPVGGSYTTVIGDPGLRGMSDSLGTYNFATAGDYEIRAVIYENGGGSGGEVSARAGSTGTWDGSFKLIGDTANGGLAIRSLPTGAGGGQFLPLVGTNLLTPMYAASRSSVFLRYAFTVSNPVSVTTLTMPIQYDDGFVAYLNGVEVARRNAPGGALSYTATATADRVNSTALIAESVDLTPFLGANLVTGTNVIAIHGLNFAAANGDFLVRPQVAQYSSATGALSFFTTATPGGFNTSAVYNKVAPVVASVARGFFSSAQSVALSTGTSGATIYYSFDGSAPSSTSPTSKSYTGAISISQTTTLRYRAEKAGSDPSDSATQTYLFTADIKNQGANTVSEGGANPVITNPAGAATATTTWPRGTFSNSYYRVSGGTTQILEYGMDTDVVGSPTYGPQIENSLKAIPSFSIVTDLSNLFDPATGIYSNPGGDEIAFERPASVELIYPDGSTGFQVNCGLRLRGGFSRSPDNPKHAFRFFFRESYGAAKLDFPLFGDDPTAASSFDKFDLRTSQNYSWSFGGDGSNFFVPDEFGRLSQLGMGQVSSHSLHAHLYVNGQYWGLYNVDERPEAKFGATYYGGDAANFDTVKIDPDLGYVVEPTDGNLTAWIQFWTLADGMTAGTGNAVYQQMQGKNPDGSANGAYPVHLDAPNLIDFMVNIYWSGNLDAPVSNFLGNNSPNNWYGFRDRTGASGGWKFVLHDSEHTLRNVNENRLGATAGNGWPAGDSVQQGAPTAQTKSNPQYICSQLLKHSSDFRAVWADRVFKHLNNSGALTVANSQARLDALKAGILSATVAESARWGDSKVQPPRTQSDFVSAIDGVRNGFLVSRNAAFISQLQTWGWYPTLLPPTWSQRGGAVNAGYSLTLTNPNGAGTIYYTLDGTDPRAFGGGVAPTASAYTGPLLINLSKTIRTRVLNAGAWSPLDEATFYTNQNFSNLIVSEIHYNPLPNGATSGDEYEFVEFKNIGGTTLDLGGLNFSSGVTFTFPVGTTLAPNALVVIARNLAQFAVRYPGVPVLGTPYTGRLDNGGERLTLLSGTGSQLIDFDYKDTAPWPITADGHGFSIVAKNPATHTDPGNGAKWRASTAIGGSPGADDPASTIAGIVINEVLTNSILPLTDTIELRNPTGSPVTVTDWWLSDDTSVPKKYRLPATTIPAGGYVTFNEAQFNPTPGAGLSFSLASTGEQVYLSSGDAGGNLTGYSHGLEFQAADNDVSFGRYVNSVGDESFPAQTARTFAAVNAAPLVGPLVINEIQYSPLTGYDEFLEIKNISASAVNLWDPANPANTWKVGGLDFSFPASTTIPAGGFVLLVAIDPAAFRAKYQIPVAVPIFGPYLGALDDNGERLELEKPAPPYLDGLGQTVVPYVIVDSLRYNNTAPWPPSAAGAGPSLQRTNSTLYGDDPANWFVSGITPGANNATNVAPTVSLASPANGASFTLPIAITLVANASDTDGFISKVEFYDGAVKIGEATTAPYSFAWSTAAPGSHTITARAIDSGLGVTTSTAISITVVGSGAGGTGTGWYAQYYNDVSGTSHLVDPPLATRTDATINFTTGSGWANTLVPGTGTDFFSVRWSGQLLVPSTSTYNFYTWSDDGVRLTVNGQTIISNWTDHGSTQNIGTIALNAGQLYDVVLEFFQGGGGGNISLEYEASGVGIARQIIPASRVYPASAPSIVTHPAPFTLTVGNTASFSVLSAGAAPLSYQWQFNSVDLAGATGQSLVIQDPLLTHAGNYRVRVTNSFSSVTSNNAALTITDTDGDGIPNYWETQYGLSTAAANNGDTDGDGSSDKSEFLAGTNPASAASRIVASVVKNIAGGGYKVSFTAQNNRSYTIQYKNALTDATWTTLVHVPAAYGVRAIEQADPAVGQPKRFYRVITPQQP